MRDGRRSVTVYILSYQFFVFCIPVYLVACGPEASLAFRAAGGKGRVFRVGGPNRVLICRLVRL